MGQALDRVGLAAAAGKKARAYSLGMKQRLGLAAALLQPRRLLVLDEPTNGLDPQGMREIRTLVRELAADGTTVFLSSHLLDEIEQVCTHAAVMARATRSPRARSPNSRRAPEADWPSPPPTRATPPGSWRGWASPGSRSTATG